MVPKASGLTNRPHVFLSHSLKNKSFVHQLVQDLNTLHIAVTLDAWEQTHGELLFQRLAQADAENGSIGLVMSSDFDALKWNSSELKHALIREAIDGHPLVLPLLIEDTPLPSFIEKKIPIDFTRNYYCALTQLAGIMYHLNTIELQESIEIHHPTQLYDTLKVLRLAGKVEF